MRRESRYDRKREKCLTKKTRRNPPCRFQEGLQLVQQRAYQENLQKGIQQGKKELAVQILRSGLVDIATIAKVTSEREDEIRSWLQ